MKCEYLCEYFVNTFAYTFLLLVYTVNTLRVNNYFIIKKISKYLSIYIESIHCIHVKIESIHIIFTNCSYLYSFLEVFLNENKIFF
jgi:hypothetical protein